MRPGPLVNSGGPYPRAQGIGSWGVNVYEASQFYRGFRGLAISGPPTLSVNAG